jgi:hypothetical protein
MILYLNGDSHVTGAEAVNNYVVADQDPALRYLGKLPHPANLAVSWGKLLSLTLNSSFHCDGRDQYTTQDIIQSTQTWLENNKNQEKLIIIQWPGWQDTNLEHEAVWALHQQLLAENIPHIFINGTKAFINTENRYDWGHNYLLNPYDPGSTFQSILKANNFDTVMPNSPHFDSGAHSFFNRFMLQYIIANKLI